MGLAWVKIKAEGERRGFEERKLLYRGPEHSHEIPVSVEKYAQSLCWPLDVCLLCGVP